MSQFDAREHFDSGFTAVCFNCGRVGEGSWPSDFLLSGGYAPTGFCCVWCAFPGKYDEDGTFIGVSNKEPSMK